MRLDYLAHSCFVLQHDGFRVLFDPYDSGIGYPPPRIFDPDLIVVSHDHHDHNAVSQVSGRSTVVRGIALRNYGPVTVSGSLGWHDEGDGAEPVSLTLLSWNGLRMAHFGDLGCALEKEQEEFFSGLDLLLMPCGGGFTFNGKRAAEVVEKIRPKVVVPMHYATPFLNRAKFPDFESADSFLTACQRFARVVTERSGAIDLDEICSSVGEGETVAYHLQHQMA